jgi:CubicO group peptidase (beta-lactamase class C family)
MIERGSFRHLLTGLRIGRVALALCMAVTSNSRAQQPAGHADSAPADVANADALAKLPALLAERYPAIQGLVLARRGCVEFEYYKAGVNAERRLPVRSVTKSVLSILVGIAIDKGYLRLDQKLSGLLPEVMDPAIDPRIRDITIRDLLTMTSGFGSAPFAASAGVRPSEMWQWVLNRQMQTTPGTHFNYDNDGVQLLSVALTRAIGQNFGTFAEQNLFRPLDITNFDWIVDGDGYLIGDDALALTARDMARIGLLVLQRGRWDDKQIVSSDYVADATVKHNDGGAPTRAAAYGYLWWVAQAGTGPDAFFAAGKGGQLIYVVPGLDLVMAMASNSGIGGGSVRFANDVVLPAASVTPGPPACIARLAQEQPLH